MQKFVMMFVAAALSISLVGCGEKPKPATQTPGAGAKTGEEKKTEVKTEEKKDGTKTEEKKTEEKKG
ncbi:MAG TPA: hypothetical protein VEJ63_08665 [Planctomycetota bacterium]|nr:hypothetical protein [Planctomycetota bacterium]